MNDIDIFAPSKEEARFFALELKGEDNIEIYETDNAFTLRIPRMPALQVIHRWTFNSPAECVQSFDFTIACAAIFATYPPEWKVDSEIVWSSLCDPSYYADLAAKRLVYRTPVRNEDAGGSILRMLKFYQMGFRIPLDSLAGVVTRLCFGIDATTATWKNRSEDQFRKVLTDLLFEVDPNTRLDRHAYLPSRTPLEERV